MPASFEPDVKHDGYETAPFAEDQPLVVGIDKKARCKRVRRRFFIWFFSAIALIFVGHAVFGTLFAYKV
jgi:hypothetical protein